MPLFAAPPTVVEENQPFLHGACSPCPLRVQCTTSRGGRTVAVGVHDDQSRRAARWHCCRRLPGGYPASREVRSRDRTQGRAHRTRRKTLLGRVGRRPGPALKVDADQYLVAASGRSWTLRGGRWTAALAHQRRWAVAEALVRRRRGRRDHCGSARGDRGSAARRPHRCKRRSSSDGGRPPEVLEAARSDTSVSTAWPAAAGHQVWQPAS